MIGLEGAGGWCSASFAQRVLGEGHTLGCVK